MASSKTYLLKSAVYTPTGGSAITLDGLKQINYRKGGSVVAHRTDANVAVSAHFLDDLEGELGIQASNASWLANTGLQPGTVGSLVITYQERKKGIGAVSGGDKTITAAQAMIGPVDAGLPDSDKSDLTIPFHCSDDSGVSPFAYG